jgi:hypothetical protein
LQAFQVRLDLEPAVGAVGFEPSFDPAGVSLAGLKPQGKFIHRLENFRRRGGASPAGEEETEDQEEGARERHGVVILRISLAL